MTLRSTLRKDAVPFRTLEYLAENGPTQVDALRDAMTLMVREQQEPDAKGEAFYATNGMLRSLIEKGFVRTKVWLTPEGLEELTRQGWKPELGDGEPAAAVPTDAVSVAVRDACGPVGVADEQNTCAQCVPRCPGCMPLTGNLGEL